MPNLLCKEYAVYNPEIPAPTIKYSIIQNEENKFSSCRSRRAWRICGAILWIYFNIIKKLIKMIGCTISISNTLFIKQQC